MISTREEVLKAILTERDYQDDLRKCGEYERGEQSVGEEALLIHHYAHLTEKAYAEKFGTAAARDVIRKIAALCFRCLETHGVMERGELFEEKK